MLRSSSVPAASSMKAALLALAAAWAEDMPAPFSRPLAANMTGSDVRIACELLARGDDPGDCSDAFTAAMAAATATYQSGAGLGATGSVDAATATSLLAARSRDGVTDSDFPASSLGYAYKLHVPLHRNRSREAWATLYDANNAAVFSFRSRGHGERASEWDGPSYPWPDFGDGDGGLTQFAPSGNTPTGLVEVDLNSPEGNDTLYGPYPVNRVARGGAEINRGRR